MTSANRVISFKHLGSITKNGKQIAIGAATETDLWKRPEAAVEAIKESFKSALIADKKPLPVGTAKVIAREGDHKSPNDASDHFTAVCQDSNGNHITTTHIPKKQGT